MTEPSQSGSQIEAAYETRLLMCERYGELQQATDPPKPFPTYEQFLEAEIARLRSGIDDIAQYDGADWDVEGVCGHAVDLLGGGFESPETRLRELLRGLVEGEDQPCSFDHHGHCQEHGWFGEPGECYTRLAREAVGLAS